ncbi:MAG: DUF454 family protein [Bacteriovoracaceae bacterium]
MKRIVYLILGIAFSLLGVVGVILPVMPGVIFFVPAAYFFSHSSRTLHQALYKIPYIGVSVLKWEETKILRPSAKAGIVFFFFTMAAYPYFFYENKTYAVIMTNFFLIVLFVVQAIRPNKK